MVDKTKRCSMCMLVLPIDEFSKKKARCKKCVNEYSKQYYSKNKEKILENQTSKRKTGNNKDLTYRQTNREKISLNKKAYYQANKEKIKEYRAKNKENLAKKSATRKKERAKTDIVFILSGRLRHRIRCAIKRQFTSKSHSTIELIGCTFEHFKNYFQRLFTKGMNWDFFMKGKIHIDHIVPCSKFNLTDPTQQKACFHYKNLQPLWAFDNLSKRDNVIVPTQMVLGI